MKGNLLVISGPSGSGKSSLMKEVLKEITDSYFSISSTTRSIREGEVDGINYHFISKEALIQAIILQDQERALARFREPIEGIHFVDYMVESIVSLTHEAFGQRALVVEIMAEGMRNPQVAAMLKNKHMTITEFVAQRMRDAQQKGEISPDINTAMTSRLLLDLTYGVLADIEAEDLAREASFAQGLRAMIGGILTAS